MLQEGWTEGGLGAREHGRLQPVKTALKRDRRGLGSAGVEPARVTHFGPKDTAAVLAPPPPPPFGARAARAHAERERDRDRHIRAMLS